jgi:type II secretory pathway component GspD/PulD (secretin)
VLASGGAWAEPAGNGVGAQAADGGAGARVTGIQAWVEPGVAAGPAVLVIGIWTEGDPGFQLNRFASPGQVALWSTRPTQPLDDTRLDKAAMKLGTSAVFRITSESKDSRTRLLFCVAKGYCVEKVSLEVRADAGACRGDPGAGQLACVRFPLPGSDPAWVKKAAGEGPVVICGAGGESCGGGNAQPAPCADAGASGDAAVVCAPCADSACKLNSVEGKQVALTVNLYNSDAVAVARIVRAIIRDTETDGGCRPYWGVKVAWPVDAAAKDVGETIKDLQEKVEKLEAGATKREIAADRVKLNDALCLLRKAVESLKGAAKALGEITAPKDDSTSTEFTAARSDVEAGNVKVKNVERVLDIACDTCAGATDKQEIDKAKVILQGALMCLCEAVGNYWDASVKLAEQIGLNGQIRSILGLLKSACDDLISASDKLGVSSSDITAMRDAIVEKLKSSAAEAAGREQVGVNNLAITSGTSPRGTQGAEEQPKPAENAATAQPSGGTGAGGGKGGGASAGGGEAGEGAPKDKIEQNMAASTGGAEELADAYHLIGGDKQLTSEKHEYSDMDTRPLVNMETAHTNYIVLLGDPAKLSELASYIKCLDQQPQIITLDVSICEFTNTGAKELGLKLGSPTNPADAALAEGMPYAGLASIFNENPTKLDAKGNPVFEAFSLGDFARTSPLQFKAVLNMLVQEGCVDIIAQPTLSTVSGRGVHYFAGDSIPYVKETAQTITEAGTLKTVTADEKQVGIQLEFVPVYDANTGEITLTILPTVTNLVEYTEISPGVKYPRIGQRTLFETMRIRPEETICLAGLIRDEDRVAIQKVPLLSQLPIAGKLFRSTNHTHERTEICICVTAHLGPNYKEGGQ